MRSARAPRCRSSTCRSPARAAGRPRRASGAGTAPPQSPRPRRPRPAPCPTRRRRRAPTVPRSPSSAPTSGPGPPAPARPRSRSACRASIRRRAAPSPPGDRPAHCPLASPARRAPAWASPSRGRRRRAVPRRARRDTGRRAPRCRSRDSGAGRPRGRAPRSPSRTRSRPRGLAGTRSSSRSYPTSLESCAVAHEVVLIPGDGTGPELAEATRRVLEATGVDFDWDVREAGADVMDRHGGNPLPDDVLEAVRRTGVALKGPITTPIGGGFRSVNVALRKSLDLFGQIRPCKTYPGVRTRFADIDLVIIRENTEDLYAGIEYEQGTPAVEELITWIESKGGALRNRDAGISIKPLSITGTRRIVGFAFDYARRM